MTFKFRIRPDYTFFLIDRLTLDDLTSSSIHFDILLVTFRLHLLWRLFYSKEYMSACAFASFGWLVLRRSVHWRLVNNEHIVSWLVAWYNIYWNDLLVGIKSPNGREMYMYIKRIFRWNLSQHSMIILNT